MRTDERHALQDVTSSGVRTADGAPDDHDSLTEVLRNLKAIGFAASYRPANEPVEDRAAVVCGACSRASAAADLHVDVERRLEGASEPDEMVLVVAATCPACGTGGVIVLGYGPEASAGDADLVAALAPPVAATGGGDDEPVADPGGDSDPDANEGFEAPDHDDDPKGSGRVGGFLGGHLAFGD